MPSRATSRQLRQIRTWPAKLAVLATLALASLALPALTPTAAASTRNTRADRTALAAYSAYLKTLLADAPAGAARDTKFADHIKRSCGEALATKQSRLARTAVASLGREIGGDTALRFDSIATTPLSRLAAKLTALRWSSARAVAAIHGFLAAERALLALPTSNLCGDAVKLAQHPKSVAAATTRFDARYSTLTDRLTQRVATFVSVLQRYEAKGDRALVGEIDRRAKRYEQRAQATTSSAIATVIADLGLS